MTIECFVGFTNACVTSAHFELKRTEQWIGLLTTKNMDELNELFSIKDISTVANKFQFSINLLTEQYRDYLRLFSNL